MDETARSHRICGSVVAALLGLVSSAVASAAIPGLTGTSFDLTAKAGYLSTADGEMIYFWGFAETAAAQVQYPGPTLIVEQGETITINLTNELADPVSLLFPGLQGPTAAVHDPGTGALRSLAPEAAPLGGTRTYVFTASQPGTYYYQSGTNLDQQVPLGLFGAIIVRPPVAGQAYGHPDSAYDREYLFLLSEIDVFQNEAAEFGESYDTSAWLAVYWFINGRTASDTMAPAFLGTLPSQPYSALVQMHPGERILVRLINLGRDLHPFHPHGQHLEVIAQDGHLLQSDGGTGADLANHQFTVNVAPGQTFDGIYTWTGAGLGWDIYGHTLEPDDTCNPGTLEPGEYAPDHCKPFPVREPAFNQVVYGEWFGGSPFLGQSGLLPPNHPGLNPGGAYVFMWHSHREMEMTNFNDFPGGMMTFAIVHAPWVAITE